MAQDVSEETLMEQNISTRIYSVDVSNSSVIQKTQKIFAHTGRKRGFFDKCRQGKTRDCGLPLHESIHIIFPQLLFPMQKLVK
jgi:hypothetical protein